MIDNTIQIFRVRKEWNDGVQSYGKWYDSFDFTKEELLVEQEKHYVTLGYDASSLMFSIESSYVTLVPEDWRKV